MPRDLTVRMDDQPGALATLGETLGAAGVNINGICGSGGGDLHLLVEDAATARTALTDAGIDVASDDEVVLVDFDNRPGELGKISRRIADTDTNIGLVYVSCDGRLVLATSDNLATRESLESS